MVSELAVSDTATVRPLARRATGDERYAKALADEWAFIRDHQIDRVHGGWHEETYEDGTPRPGVKGHAWKAAYHDGRALLATARLLRNPA
ncbi:MAG: hypothetical protein EON56_03935 [Alphaproteobacteria bacterium]|nr:MAG: hypothetical protein EON56_03935 [Alphaproteobacteria bacterium]